MALGQQAKSDIEKNITEYVKKEQPITYQTVEGTYYFLSATGKAVYLTREIVLDIAPLIARVSKRVLIKRVKQAHAWKRTPSQSNGFIVGANPTKVGSK